MLLVALSGLPGSGKTRLAREVCTRLPLAHVESDALRKELFPRPVYTPAESSRLFAACHALIERLLQQRVSVAFDATNLKEPHREPLYQIAATTGARLVMVRVTAPDVVIRRRLVARAAGADEGNASEADVEVFEMMRREVEPISVDHLTIDTRGDIAEAAAKIVRKLGDETA